jgi:hypothetical protein
MYAYVFDKDTKADRVSEKEWSRHPKPAIR